MWRRIAYLSNKTFPVVCPMGFERINDPNVPALCKRNQPGAARCSPITYSTNGIPTHKCMVKYMEVTLVILMGLTQIQSLNQKDLDLQLQLH